LEAKKHQNHPKTNSPIVFAQADWEVYDNLLLLRWGKSINYKKYSGFLAGVKSTSEFVIKN